jgi:hypothetical protein
MSALRRRRCDATLLAAGLTALAVLSATVVTADRAGPGSAGQVPFAGSAWADTGFWSASPASKPGAVAWYRAVSCPTAQFCVAWGNGPFGASVWSLSSDGGASWQPAERPSVSPPANWGPGHLPFRPVVLGPLLLRGPGFTARAKHRRR